MIFKAFDFIFRKSWATNETGGMNQQTEYWIKSANHDLDVAETLFQGGKFDWCLFLGHLVLEKTLKACYTQKTGSLPPRTHDLVRLANSAGIHFDDETLEFLDAVNTFNVSTRYPDEKLQFYKMCTPEFTSENFSRIKEIQTWLLKMI
ncbi:MAG: HEPN domain-containing protein [Thermodesulfobacteriota bacterium]|nr:HEPN domain-containing protein [Thermodesulfobacteriota bacterium]